MSWRAGHPPISFKWRYYLSYMTEFEIKLKKMESILVSQDIDEPVLLAIFHAFVTKLGKNIPQVHIGAGHNEGRQFIVFEFNQSMLIFQVDYPILEVFFQNKELDILDKLDYSPNISVAIRDKDFSSMVDYWVETLILTLELDSL